MIHEIKTSRIGIQGQRPLTEKTALMELRAQFISRYKEEPKQLRVSPKCFNDLRAFAERWEYTFGFDVKVDNDFEENQWVVCNENTKVYAVEEWSKT